MDVQQWVDYLMAWPLGRTGNPIFSFFLRLPQRHLFKLSQRGSMNEYLTEFGRLAKQIVGLAPSFLLSCFASGLSPDIRREVQALQPISLSQATALAKLQEDKLEDQHRHNFRGKGALYMSLTSASTPRTPFTLNIAPLLQTPPKIHLKKLSLEEMMARHEKGLCYNCDEKFSIGHKCKGCSSYWSPMRQRTPFLMNPHRAHRFSWGRYNGRPLRGANQPQCPLYLPAPETFRVLDHISKHQLTILIDRGSIHNFVQDCVTKFFGLPLQPTKALKVMVGNGTMLECRHLCPHVPIHIKGQYFEVDLHVLPISSADVVLGIQWLQELGPLYWLWTTHNAIYT